VGFTAAVPEGLWRVAAGPDAVASPPGLMFCLIRSHRTYMFGTACLSILPLDWPGHWNTILLVNFSRNQDTLFLKLVARTTPDVRRAPQ
jgi:hypothetical protein